MMAGFRPLADSEIITVDLDDDNLDNPGETKSWGDGKLFKGKGDLKVEIEPLYQVHGQFNEWPVDKDNASLLVFKFLPKPKNREHKVLKLMIELRLLMRPRQVDDDDDDEWDDYPEIVSVEPSNRGAQYVDERVTDVTKQKENKITVTAPVKGPTLGAERSATETRAFQEHDLLTIATDLEKTDQSIHKKDLVRWTVTAASPDQGVGDSLTVAVLIKRAPESQFCLSFSSDGRLGSWVDKAMKPFPFLKRKQQYPMGLYGPGRHDQDVPEGVLVSNLQAAMTNRALLNRLKVGLHLPELVAPVTYYQEEGTSQSMSALARKIMTANTSEGTVPPSTTEAQSAGGEETPRAPISGGTDAGKPTLDPAATASPAKASSNTAKRVLFSDVRSGQERAVTDGAKEVPPRVTTAAAGMRRDSQALPVAASSCSCQNQLNGFGTTTEYAASRSQARRAERHRMIAALYERLARLHREEAEEFVPPDEVAYVDEVVRPEMGF